MLKINQKLNKKLAVIIFFAFAIRIFGINWDQGLYLHPDERMILMVANTIRFFNSLNPQFFSYGSLPVYLVKGISQLIDFFFSTHWSNYGQMLYVGRVLSIIFDCTTIFFIYRIAQFIWKRENLSLLAAFIYTITFFAIQNSHFYTVDTLFTTLTTLLLYVMLKYITVSSRQRPFQRYAYLILIGATFSALFTTKFTAIVFYPIILSLFILTMEQWNYRIIAFIIFHFSFLVFSFVFMPYMFLDFGKFYQDIHLQLTMGRNPYVFPYTLQFVGTLPYLHYLKNIVLWGLGPFLSLLGLCGITLIVKNGLKTKALVLFSGFYILYGLVVGASAVKFMRYMLPVYPFFAITAGYCLYWLYQLKNRYAHILFWTVLISSCVWTAMFLNIYTQQHTRINASNWMDKNIPLGSTIAVEYWDDYLPLYNPNRYTFNVLHMYDNPDDEQKWQIINNQLKHSDYLVIASNRVYAPIQKLSNCAKYDICFPIASTYYDLLFNNKYGYQLIKQFAVYPFLQLGPWKLQINDQSAEESFTVYDHPKIFIFKKNDLKF